jgi:hypothetical protein
MRCFANSENQKVGRSLLYVLQDLFLCIAGRDESSWIAKLFRILRHDSIESTIEALSYLAQSVWMIDGTTFNYVEYIDFRTQRLRKRDRKHGRPGGCGSQICSVENAMERRLSRT